MKDICIIIKQSLIQQYELVNSLIVGMNVRSAKMQG